MGVPPPDAHPQKENRFEGGTPAHPSERYMIELNGHMTKGRSMKITKREAERAKASAKAEKQRVLGQPKKNLSTQDKRNIAAQNAIIEAADRVIRGED
jgi:hypothetical protein